MFFLLFIPGTLSVGFHRQLGFLIPSDRQYLPQNITTGLYGILLPELEGIPKPINRNIQLLESVLKGNVFDETYASQLYPMFNLKEQVQLSIGTIKKYVAQFGEILKDARIGTDDKRTETFPLTLDTIFHSLKFHNINSLTTSIRKVNTISEPEGSGEGVDSIEAYKVDPKYLKALGFMTNLNQDLKIFALRFKSLVNSLKSLKSGNMDQLRKEFFFKDFLESSLHKEIKLIDTTYFYKTASKLEININLALYSDHVEYTQYTNVQYYSRKLADTYFSMPSSDEYFRLNCIAPTVCIPAPTDCSRALYNESTYTILTKCNFEHSTVEFEVLPTVGILVNKEPVNKAVKKLLRDQSVEPKNYPFLLQFSGCLELNEGKFKVCFTNEKQVIYSHFTHDIWKLINPLWYNSLLGYIKDFPLLVYVSFSIMVYALITFGCLTVKGRIEKLREKRKQNEGKEGKSQKPRESSENKAKKSKPSSSKRTDNIVKEEHELRNLVSKRD